MTRTLINILTRTSSRPIGFEVCHASIVNQTYKDVNHIVSYENDHDLKYLESNKIKLIKVVKQKSLKNNNESGYIHAPYNLYCNDLLDNVKEGWVMFLDDDDNLLHNKVLDEITKVLKTCTEDTLILWKMRYPNGNVIPSKEIFKNKSIKINNIGSCCFIFHINYRNNVLWDEWKGSDFRFLKALSNHIPNQKWIDNVYIQINNFGDFGNQNDLKTVLNRRIFKKNWLWHVLPKYHNEYFGFKFFNKDFYSKLKLKLFK